MIRTITSSMIVTSAMPVLLVRLSFLFIVASTTTISATTVTATSTSSTLPWLCCIYITLSSLMVIFVCKTSFRTSYFFFFFCCSCGSREPSRLAMVISSKFLNSSVAHTIFSKSSVNDRRTFSQPLSS